MVTYVMSIKKEYGMNLLEHKALWEYRRRKSRIDVGDRILLYATAPDSELIGEFIVGEVITGSPNDVWEKTKKDVCYQKNEVVPYLESGDFPISFKVNKPKKYQQAISIYKIPFFRPPMSYCKAQNELLSFLGLL
ncbi:MAG: hypothetical protein Q7S56_02640 [Nanoarchaeota archaeon]|nr:hypothetical protein [Nanoarchaeota archaeon]